MGERDQCLILRRATMSTCRLLKNTGLRLTDAICYEDLQRSIGITCCGSFIRPGPSCTVTGYRTLAKEEVPRKRSSGRSYYSKREPDMNYTTQGGGDVLSLTLIPNEMIIIQDTYGTDHAFTISVTRALLGCSLRGRRIFVVTRRCSAEHTWAASCGITIYRTSVHTATSYIRKCYKMNSCRIASRWMTSYG